MKILVTGALGHIGSELIRILPISFPGCNVVMIDSLITQRYCSLFNLPKEGSYKFIEGDITQIEIQPLLDGVDVVVHLAAITDATSSFSKAAEVENNNYNSTRLLAHACAQYDVRLITISSTSVYGSQAKLVDEECPLDELKPQSPYAVTKLKEERLVQKLAREEELKAVIFRFGTIFGTSPGMRFHTAVNKFCWQAAMDLPITVWTTAFDQKRPYLELGDACRAIVHGINKKDLFDGRVFNVLSLNASVREIVEVIRSFIPNLEVRFVDSVIMNQLSYEVCDSQFCATGFRKSGKLADAIEQEINLLTSRQVNVD
jgi:UDP-glucose 4-epimerase